MGEMISLVLLLCCVAMVVCAWLLRRNSMVFRFVTELIDVAYSGPDWEKLDCEYRRVTYEEMLYSLKPLESFYEGTELLKRYREQYGKK